MGGHRLVRWPWRSLFEKHHAGTAKEQSLEGTPSMGVGDGATSCGHIDVATSFGQLSGR